MTNAHPQPALSLWKGQTVHVRYQPFERRFAYDLVLIDLDIDRLDEAAASSALFSVNAPGLFAFRTEDHGAKQKGAPPSASSPSRATCSTNLRPSRSGMATARTATCGESFMK